MARNSYALADRVFGLAGVDVATPDCTVWSYGFVVDEATGDATTSALTLSPYQ